MSTQPQFAPQFNPAAPYPYYGYPQQPGQQPGAAAGAPGSGAADSGEPKLLTKPQFTETKPLDPNVVGKEAAAKGDAEQKKAKEQYDKDMKAYEAQQKQLNQAADAASGAAGKAGAGTQGAEPPTLDPAIQTALNNLYNVVHVPDQGTVEQTVAQAMAPPPDGGASGAGAGQVGPGGFPGYPGYAYPGYGYPQQGYPPQA